MKILINDKHGGYGFSENFVIHIESLTKDQLVNTSELWKRHNPFLVEEAIKFGLKNASGLCSNLKVIEIPDGSFYSISEYDGLEWIDEIWIEATLDELKEGLSQEKIEMVSKGCSVKLKI